MILNSPYVSGSLTVTGNIIASGSITLSGSVASASYAANAELLDGKDSSEFTTTASFNSYTASNDASVLSATMATVTNAAAIAALTAKTSSYATTGSNTLTGVQYVSNTNDAIGFSNTTSSIYTDGGLQVTKNAYFSSSMFIKGNLTVYGTQSVSFITSSQLNISTNVITVNTNTPSIRFGGLSVYDSGSTGATGSIFWDSQNNHWIYTNPSGSSYSGGMLISGPRNTGSIGDEQGTTLNAIMKGMGGDHITSSIMFESASFVGIGTSSPAYKLHVYNPSSASYFDGGTTDTSFYISHGSYNPGQTISGIRVNTGSPVINAKNGGTIYFNRDVNTADVEFQYSTGSTPALFISGSGRIGIGTNSPSTKVHIYESLTNSTAYLTVQNNRARNAAVQTTTTNGSFIAGTSIGTDTFNYQIYDGVAGSARLTISSTGAATFSNNITIGSSLSYGYIYGPSNQIFGSVGANITWINSGTSGLRFNNAADNQTRMFMSDAGNFFIGDTTNASGDPTFYVKNKAGAVANIAGWNFGSTSTADNANNNLLNSGAYYNGSSMVATQTTATGYQQYSGIHVFYTDTGLTPGNAYSNTERMRISSGGLVSINTTTSAATLNLKAQSGNRVILFQNPSGGDGSLWLYGASNSIDYSFSTYSVSNAFYLYNNGNYDFAGSDVSDRRLKENIKVISYSATEKLMQLVPKSYNMIAHPDIKRSGFIAQEVKEILPDLINGEEKEDEYLGLDYNGLLAIAIKAIQELKAQNDDLQSQINELKA